MNASSSATTGADVLVVDDTPANLRVLAEMLSSCGLRVRLAPNGRLALQSAQKHPPDLILLDIMMPEMDGYEVCRRFGEHERLKAIPVIFLSALSEAADKVQAFAAGGVDYITKPFQFEEVHARVETHLRLRRAQMQLEEQNRALQESNDQIRRLEALRDDLVHMVVHDLRSPLSATHMTLELLLRTEMGRLSERATDRIQRALSSTEATLAMVSSLLDISRMEAGEMPLDLQPCDLVALAAKALDSVEPLRGERRLLPDAAQRSVILSCDRNVILRVFQNLLTNAIKFTPDGGTIRTCIHVCAEEVRITVADDGPGIPPQFHERIFEKFGQVEARTQRQLHSTGLGLAFCKLAVESHGGRIGLESEVGRGSVFWFTLPLAVENGT